MKVSPTFKFPFRRKKERRTDYKRRLKLLGSRRHRLVVRRSLNYIQAQIVDFGDKGDKTIISSNSKSLKKIGWKFSCDSTPAAYLTGLALGKNALKNKIQEVILDIGLYNSTKGSRIYAVVKGVTDAGMKIPFDEKMYPEENRISGKHIAEFNEKFKDLPAKFEEIKKTIGGNE